MSKHLFDTIYGALGQSAAEIGVILYVHPLNFSANFLEFQMFSLIFMKMTMV